MDSIVEQIVEHATSVRFDALSNEVKGWAVERFVDAVACGVGGADFSVVSAAARVLPSADVELPHSARALGERRRTRHPAAAAFLNASMIRYLDFNDTYPGGHPSDALGGLMALADSRDSSGADLLQALVVGYDVFIRVAGATQMRERGWDQGFGIALATAAGASSLLGLSVEQTRNAVSLAAVANVPMRATRAGELSEWKGAATALSCSSALFTTLLAAEGTTGPAAPFDGRHGLKDLVTGPFELDPFPARGGSFRTDQARIKIWPVEYHLQAAVWAAIELRRRITSPQAIQSIAIRTYWSAWHETGSEPEKWDPRTRETADHSMPYVFCTALATGELGIEAFEPANFLDAHIRGLMSRVTVQQDQEIEAQFPDRIVMVVEAALESGAIELIEITNPLGHEQNPATRADISAKFTRLAKAALGDRTDGVLGELWEVARAPRFRTVLDRVSYRP